MPYVNIKITREGATAEQKAELIRGSLSSCATSWERTPRRRWSSSTRSTPTAGGSAASRSRSDDAVGPDRRVIRESRCV